MPGADLRALRKSRGLTLSDVAEHLDKSIGWLSQVERGLSPLPPGAVRRLARILDVAPSLLEATTAATPEEAGRIVRAANRRDIGPREPGLTETLVSPDLTDPFEMIHSTFLPGHACDGDRQRPTQEIGYMLAGRLNLTISGQDYVVGPGDSFRIRDEPYRWSNPYDVAAVALWVISPPIY